MIHRLSHIHSHMLCAFTKLTLFDLWDCKFATSSDVLRLLGSMRALVYVAFYNVSIDHVSATSPTPRGSRVRFVRVGSDSGKVNRNMSSLAQCFTWRHLPDKDAVHGFDGINAVSLSGIPSPIDSMVIETTTELEGYPFNLDMNSGFPIGVGRPLNRYKINRHAKHLIRLGTMDD